MSVIHEAHGQAQVALALVEWYLGGRGRNLDFVRKLEEHVGTAFDLSSPELEGLEHAFAMHGAGNSGHDEAALEKELRRALPMFEKEPDDVLRRSV